jgi:hypothetical protein
LDAGVEEARVARALQVAAHVRTGLRLGRAREVEPVVAVVVRLADLRIKTSGHARTAGKGQACTWHCQPVTGTLLF